MELRAGFDGTIGNTPLIRLEKLSAESGCEILGKAEFLNPGGSVKDRAALWMVRDHERAGRLKPGGTVVEGTAGNTGIGLVHVSNARGYRCIIYMPDNQSQEKVTLLITTSPVFTQLYSALPMGSASTMRMSRRCSLRYRLTPASVPPVPVAATKASTLPSVCVQISGPVAS